MEFLAARCPNCGGELRLPDDRKQVKCMYCGFDVIVRDAISAAGSNVANWLQLAASAEETGNYAESYKYFTQVLEYEPDNYFAHFGKAINAGYLSKPDKFRSEELIKGVKAAVENAPEDKKQEIKLHAAEKILSVCSEFRVDDQSDKAKLQRISVIECLELAHAYDPENTQVLTSLYFQYGLHSLSYKVFNLRYQTNNFDDDISENKQKADECLAKLDVLDPKQATYLRKSEKESEDQFSSVNATGGSGCLVTLMVFLLTSLGAVFLLI